MIKILKNALLYNPEPMGKKDLLIIGDKIAGIYNEINTKDIPFPYPIEIIDLEGDYLIPGFIDSHVHITGGGGEGGFKTRTPEISFGDIVKSGITTIVGCLGTDGISRSMECLLAKSRALDEEGITSFIYTGSYHIPLITITGDIMKDIIDIDKIIGIGEIALKDHRSSQPTFDEFIRISADSRVAGILSKKCGIVNIHMGDGKGGLEYVRRATLETEIPLTQFLPTHINRNEALLKDGISYALSGGFIDFTTSSDNTEDNLRAGKCLQNALSEGVPIDNITFSSDGQGSLPIFNEKKEFIGLGIGRVSSLYDEVKYAIQNGVPIEDAVKVITKNPAKLLKLNSKGSIIKDYDADMVALDRLDLSIKHVIAKGKILLKNKKQLVLGTFENSKEQ